MGFWNKFNNEHGSRRCKTPEVKNNDIVRINPLFSEINHKVHNCIDASQYMTGASGKRQRKVFRNNADSTGYPEWENDPDYIAGCAASDRIDIEAMEHFANAAEKGNMLAWVGLGDYICNILHYYASSHSGLYRIGSDEIADGILKVTITSYLIASFEKSFEKEMTARLEHLAEFCSNEAAYYAVLQEVSESLTEYAIAHPHEFLRQMRFHR